VVLKLLALFVTREQQSYDRVSKLGFYIQFLFYFVHFVISTPWKITYTRSFPGKDRCPRRVL